MIGPTRTSPRLLTAKAVVERASVARFCCRTLLRAVAGCDNFIAIWPNLQGQIDDLLLILFVDLCTDTGQGQKNQADLSVICSASSEVVMLQKQSISTLRIWLVASSLLFPLYTFTADAQQITGVPGSPSATVTIDGKQLPPPPIPFGGVIKEKASEFEALVAAARRAAEGRAQRAAHHDG